MKSSVLLSVIVPTRNRSRRVADLLDSLAGQEPVPFKWEVIVVDNASTDDTQALIQRKSRELDIAIRYVLEPRLGLHQGRHRGAREAGGDYLGYLDDDMVLAPTWVQGVQWLVQGKAEAVVGRTLPKWEAQPPPWLLALVQGGTNAYLGLLDLGKVARPVDPGLALGGNCFLPSRLVFDLGGFHPDGMPVELLRYRGDGETALMAAFRRAGLRGYYDPRATAYHIIGADRLTVESLCQRACRQGVSDSFTSIRAGYLGEKAPFGGPRRMGGYIQRAREMSLAEILEAILRKSTRPVRRLATRLRGGEGYVRASRRLEEAYRSGWRFHQEEVKSDSELLEYVTQKDYLGEEAQGRELAP